MNLHLVFAALMVLTGATAWSYSQDSQGNLTLLVLGAVKLLLVAFFFMDLKASHLFWKSIIVTFFIAFLGTSFIVHAS